MAIFPAMAHVLESLENRLLLAVAPTGPEFQTNTTTVAAATNPALAVAPAGSVVSAWMVFGAAGLNEVYAQFYNSLGQRQGSEIRVNTYTEGQQAFPSASVDDAGNYLITWSSAGQDGSGYGVYGQRYSPAGTPLGAEFRLNTTTAGDESDVHFAMAGDGTFVASWSQNLDVIARRFNADGTPIGNEIKVNTQTPGIGPSPNIALAPNGTFVVAWPYGLSNTNGINEIHAQVLSAAGDKVGGEFVKHRPKGHKYF